MPLFNASSDKQDKYRVFKKICWAFCCKTQNIDCRGMKQNPTGSSFFNLKLLYVASLQNEHSTFRSRASILGKKFWVVQNQEFQRYGKEKSFPRVLWAFERETAVDVHFSIDVNASLGIAFKSFQELWKSGTFPMQAELLTSDEV